MQASPLLSAARRGALLGALLTATSCGVSSGQAEMESAGSCGSAVKREGEVYAGLAVADPRRLPRRTGSYEATTYGCGDDAPTRLPGLAGVPPRAALAERDGRFVYLPERAFTLHVLARHPLHAALSSDGEGRSAPRSCRRARRFQGTVGRRTPTTAGVPLSTAAGSVSIRIVETTMVRGAGRAPALWQGDRVAVVAARCGGKRLVARRITLLS